MNTFGSMSLTVENKRTDKTDVRKGSVEIH